MSAAITSIRMITDRLERAMERASDPIAAALQRKRSGPPAYHPHCADHCPDCGGTNWLVGRITSECAACGLPRPLVHIDQRRPRKGELNNGTPS